MTHSSQQTLTLIIKISLASVAFLLVLGGGALLFIRSDGGREFVRKKFNEALSGEIHGKFELKHLDKISFDRIDGRDLIITAPNGEKVIELRDISMKPVWGKILTGNIQASTAIVTGGVFRITEIGDSLSIIQALNAPPKPKEEKKEEKDKGEGGEAIHVLIEDIHAKGIEVVVHSKSMPPIIIKDINGLVRFETEEKVTVRLDKANGHMDLPVLGDTKLRNLSGRVKSKTMDVIDFKLAMELGDLVPTHFIYRVPENEKKPGDPKMIMRFSKEKSPDFFSKLVLNMADAFTSLIDVGFED